MPDRPKSPPRGSYGRRPSKSADTVRQAQIADERAMSPYERMVLALELGELCEQVGLLWAADKEKS